MPRLAPVTRYTVGPIGICVCDCNELWAEDVKLGGKLKAASLLFFIPNHPIMIQHHQHTEERYPAHTPTLVQQFPTRTCLQIDDRWDKKAGGCWSAQISRFSGIRMIKQGEHWRVLTCTGKSGVGLLARGI